MQHNKIVRYGSSRDHALSWTPLLVAVVLLLAACGPSSNSHKSPSRSVAPAASSVPLATSAATLAPTNQATAVSAAAAPPVQGQLTVFAAASLTEVFKQIGSNIQQANPGTKITFNFAGSPTLRTQLGQGAHADIFASADQPNMQGAQQDGSIAGQPQIFAQNRLVVITPGTNPKVTQLQDLAKSGTKVVLEHPSVPAGSYARQALMKMSQDPTYGSDYSAKVLANVVSEETDVKAVLSKVQLGEADAGVVYTTDAASAPSGAVKAITIPDQFNVIAQYPIAVVKGAGNPTGAQAFISYLLSPAGQAVLKANGFIVGNG